MTEVALEDGSGVWTWDDGSVIEWDDGASTGIPPVVVGGVSTMSGSVISSIPASEIVQINPSVISAGGSALDIIGLMLTKSKRVPVGTVLSFPNGPAVTEYFGALTIDDLDGNVYFRGFTGCDKLPGALLVTQYPLSAVSAWLRGGRISTLTLTQLRALNGVLTLDINGTPVTSAAIDLTAATSFSDAAQRITTALGTTGPTQATITAASLGASFTATGAGTSLTVSAVTGIIHNTDVITGTGIPLGTTIQSQISGTPGGAGVYATSAVTTASAASCTTTSNVLEVQTMGAGVIELGQQLIGTAVAANSTIVQFLTGTGGVGTYLISSRQNVPSEAMSVIIPTVTYDSIAGAFLVTSNTVGVASTLDYATGTIASSLLLTQSMGAILSIGANAGVPAAFMDDITARTQNWASFWHNFDPDNGAGNTQKKAFADWNTSKNLRYAYVVEDTDPVPTESNAAPTSLGYYCKTLTDGVMVFWQPSVMHLAAFNCGCFASIAFANHEGRTTLAFRRQAGLQMSVNSATVAKNLIANGYNFTGDYATANDEFRWMYPGQISGDFQWADSYINQIWLNAGLQLAFMTLLQTAKSIPYNPPGFGLVRHAALDPINAAVNFGAIRAGVILSEAQIGEVNNEAGLKIDTVLSTLGWYLQILPAPPITRQARGTPPIKLWYMDGQSIQRIVMGSILVQ